MAKDKMKNIDAQGNTAKSVSSADQEMRAMLCDGLSFSAAEAYKMLRTSLTFILPDENRCRVIGVTSAIRGEGKTTTAINLSYTLAQTEKRVLLIDADMRLPTVAKKLGIPGKPGFSNLLVHMNSAEEVLHKSKILPSWDILPAGNIPPNPSELLGSERMRRLMEELGSRYDYIVIDLPPVNIVSDALVIAELLDGYLLTVRENYTDRHSVNECMRQMSFMEKGKMMGFVMTNSAESDKIYHRYGRSGKYGKYGGKYGKKYGYRYGYRYGKDSEGGRNYEDVWQWQHQTKERQPQGDSAVAAEKIAETVQK